MLAESYCFVWVCSRRSLLPLELSSLTAVLTYMCGPVVSQRQEWATTSLILWGFLWRSLFVNRPAASARQFNSAQTGAAVSITTWMLSSSREMRKETELALQACMLVFKHHQLGCLMARNTGCRAQLNLTYEIPCNLIPFYSSNQYRYQWKPVGMIRPRAITQMHEFIEIYNTFLTSFPCSM